MNQWEVMRAPTATERPKRPEGGKCSQCGERALEFHDDGSGMCSNCGYTFMWDKSKEQETPGTTTPPQEQPPLYSQPVQAPPISAPPQAPPLGMEGPPPYASSPPDQTPPSLSAPPPPPAPYAAPSEQFPQQAGAAPYPGPPSGTALPPGIAPPPGTALPPGAAPPPGLAPLPFQYYQQPPPPATMDDLEPNTKKAWKKMKKRFKGGMGPGIWGGVGAGIMYIMIPLVPLIIIPMLVPSDFDMKEAPEFIQTLFTKLWAIPLMLGWFMVLAGFFKKYYRRGSPQRAISFVSFSAGKALYMYAFFAPFIISISIGDGGMDLDYRGYFTILYSLIALGALYSVFECIALRKDLDSYYNGIIPIEYYPRKYRKEVPPPPAPPGDQAPPPIPPGTPLPPPASPEDPTYSLPPPPAPDPQYSPPPDQGAPPSYPPPQDQEMPPSYSPPPDQ